MLAAFSRKAVIASLGGHTGDIQLTVSGNIATGVFEGNSKVKVIKPKWYEYLIFLFTREWKEIVAQERKGLSADELSYLTLSEDADNLSQKTSGIKAKIPAMSKPNIRTEIIQLRDNPAAYVEFQAMLKEAGETAEGYVKRTAIKGCPAIELYDKKSHTSQIQALVKESYILKLEAEPPVASQALMTYAEQILAKM